MAYSRLLLSGSTNGRPIPIAATATPGTTLHTAVAGSIAFDEVYAWASNITASNARLTVEFGGVSDPGDHLVKSYLIPPYSPPIPVATGQPVQGAVVIRAFSDVASAINVVGYVNRIA